MHSMTREVLRTIPALEFGQFQDPDDRERLNEIRALVGDLATFTPDPKYWKALGIRNAQVPDDTNSITAWHQVDRVGREWVEHGDTDKGEQLWKRWADDQVAIEVNMAPLIRELTQKQYEVTRLLFYGSLSTHQVAAVQGITHKMVRKHRDASLKKLGDIIRSRFLHDDAPSVERVGSPIPAFAGVIVTEPAYLDEPYVPVPRAPVGHVTLTRGRTKVRVSKSDAHDLWSRTALGWLRDADGLEVTA